MVIGKSGSGRVSLLKHIIGLLSPDEGILFRGKPVDEMKKGEGRGVRSAIFQNNALFHDGLENIASTRQTTNLKKKESNRR